LIVQYFDQSNGASHFALYVGAHLVDQWVADDRLPSPRPDGSSSTRRLIPGVSLHPGDEIRIEGRPDGHEYAPLDYIEIANGSNGDPAAILTARW
jgi:alpha-glucuronidase